MHKFNLELNMVDEDISSSNWWSFYRRQSPLSQQKPAALLLIMVLFNPQSTSPCPRLSGEHVCMGSPPNSCLNFIEFESRLHFCQSAAPTSIPGMFSQTINRQFGKLSYSFWTCCPSWNLLLTDHDKIGFISSKAQDFKRSLFSECYSKTAPAAKVSTFVDKNTVSYFTLVKLFFVVLLFFSLVPDSH